LFTQKHNASFSTNRASAILRIDLSWLVNRDLQNTILPHTRNNNNDLIILFYGVEAV